MKWKEIAITVLACILLTAAGTLGFSALYQALFQPDTIIDDSRLNPGEWRDEQARYVRRVLYPLSFSLESGNIVEIDGKELFSDLYHVSQPVYSSVLGLAKVNWEDAEDAVVTAYEYQADSTEYDRYRLRLLFHIVLTRGSGSEDMLIAVDQNNMPVLFLYGTADKAGGMKGDIAVSGLSALPDDFSGELYAYLTQIETALDGQSSYQLLVTMIQDAIPSEEAKLTQERPRGSLAEYCKYGEWKIYSDSQSAACVCIINDYNFILYYDLENGGFCGYSIALNDIG